MNVRELAVPGAWEITPQLRGDSRGMFFEWFTASAFHEFAGHDFTLAQANCSVSMAGVLRGLHFTELPPSQAKYVTCVRGAVFDVAVDIRVGSPTFGHWDAVRLDEESRRTIYLSYGRTRPESFLRTFDCPDMTSDSQSQRFRSALPSQALALLNNSLIRRTSRAFAQQVLEQAKGNNDQALDLAFGAAYSRKPYPEELEIARRVISKSTDPKEGLRLFLQGMMGANDFLYSF